MRFKLAPLLLGAGVLGGYAYLISRSKVRVLPVLSNTAGGTVPLPAPTPPALPSGTPQILLSKVLQDGSLTPIRVPATTSFYLVSGTPDKPTLVQDTGGTTYSVPAGTTVSLITRPAVPTTSSTPTPPAVTPNSPVITTTPPVTTSPVTTSPATTTLPSGTWIIWASHAYQVQRYDAGTGQYWLLPAAPNQPIAIPASQLAVEAAPKAAAPGLFGYVSVSQLNIAQQSSSSVITGQDQYGMFITAKYDYPNF